MFVPRAVGRQREGGEGERRPPSQSTSSSWTERRPQVVVEDHRSQESKAATLQTLAAPTEEGGAGLGSNT